jgi:hypothetical protein
MQPEFADSVAFSCCVQVGFAPEIERSAVQTAVSAARLYKLLLEVQSLRVN